MVKGQIIIKLSDGSTINYANKYLKKKRGSDNATPSNEMFEGFPEFSYYYTGYGDDTYEKQAGAGTIKADYEFLTKQIDTVGDNILEWPESSTSKKAISKEGEGDTVLIRSTSSTVNSGNTFSRIKVLVNEIVSINIVEHWATFPYGKESGYQLPKSSPNFRGFAESKETPKSEKGPDFNEYWDTENDYIPRPSVKSNPDGTYTVTNTSQFSKIVEKKFSDGHTEVYGVRKYQTSSGIKERNSASTVVYPWEMPSTLKYDELDTVLPTLTSGKEYSFKVDTKGVDPAQFRGNEKTKTASQSPFGAKLAKSKAMLNVSLDLPDTVSDTTLMLYKNTKVKSINITKASNLTIANNMFAECSKLESANTSKFTKVDNASRLISGCKLIKNIDMAALSNVTNASYMFAGSGITNVDLSTFNKVTDASGMLSDTAITSANISSMKALDNSTEMFMNCTSLKDIDWKDIKPTTFDRMFQGATADKVIECYTEDMATFIDTNAVAMGLEKYTNNLKKKKKINKVF